MKKIYMAHPLGSEPERRFLNIQHATLWLAYLAEHFEVIPLAPWIDLARVWPETRRELGLLIDRALIEHGVDEFWMVGPRASPGMLCEREWAIAADIPIVDLIHWSLPPIDPRVLCSLARDRGCPELNMRAAA